MKYRQRRFGRLSTVIVMGAFGVASFSPLGLERQMAPGNMVIQDGRAATLLAPAILA
jgi:hypothetical protein